MERRTQNKLYPPKLMGIVNCTPDSFFDGGEYYSQNAAIKQGIKLADQGADILDIGAESTRPNADYVSEEEEKKRLLPVIETLSKSVTIPISVDTYKPSVAREALMKGASIINDITGAQDPMMRQLAKEFKCTICVMHMLGTPKTMQQDPFYEKGVFKTLTTFFEERCQTLIDEGVSEKKIWIDPGIGFGKTVEDNLTILRHLPDLQSLGFPIVLGISRKSFMGKILNNDVEERLNATIILNTIASMKQPLILRVHDIKAHKEISSLMEAF